MKTGGEFDKSVTRFLLLGAMDEEIRALLELIEVTFEEQWCNFTLYWGTLDSVPVVLCKSGIGKVFSAMITQHVIDSCQPEAVLFTGVAGALSSDLEPGDIIIGARLIHHDFDVKGLGFEIGHIPFTEYRFFEADPFLMAAAGSVGSDSGAHRAGIIGTGDQFVTDKSAIPELGLDCVDMEGASVAQVCTANGIPFLILRIISDKADGSAGKDFLKNLPRFASGSASMLRHVVRTYRPL